MTKRAAVTILQAINDPALFAPWFKHRESWASWFAFLTALFGLSMTPEQLAIYQQCTGRTAPPAQPHTEAWLVCGRRAGKSFMLALCAVYLAAFHDYRKYLAPGERATVMVVAADRKQARVILRYMRGLLTHVPMLARMIQREAAESFDLNNGTTIEIGTVSFKSTRGYTICAALLDELAFWTVDADGANPDTEVIAAIRPGMLTIPGAMLLAASSPYARRGALYSAWREHFGKDGDPVLVWQAETRRMNPSVPKATIDEAYENDPASAAAEYGAVFRADVETLLTRETVEAAVVEGRRELEPASSVKYTAFVDPSGGSADSMTLAIAHMDRQTKRVVIDAVRERRPPFSPDAVAKEFSDLIKSYHLHKVTGDRYGGEWPRERFRAHGIQYALSDAPKSDIYGALLPLMNAGRVELLDIPRLSAQLIGLERKTARSGRDSIDHAPGAHDDVCNAVAGAAVAAHAHKPMVVSPALLQQASMPSSHGRMSRGPLTPIEWRGRQKMKCFFQNTKEK